MLASAPLSLGLEALLASALPALRAAGVEPMVAATQRMSEADALFGKNFHYGVYQGKLVLFA
jgi:hypothetical protein